MSASASGRAGLLPPRLSVFLHISFNTVAGSSECAMSQTSIVTVLFTDLVQSTDALSRLGEGQAEALRQTHFALLREAIVKHRPPR